MSNLKRARGRRGARCGVYAIVAAVMIGCAGTGSLQPEGSPESPQVVLPAAAETIWLSNGRVTVGVAPQVGRVVHFGPGRERNLLWLSDEAPPAEGYANYGGEKLWPTLQEMWPRVYGQGAAWPPDPRLDGPAWEVVERTTRCVVLSSPVSEALSLRVERRLCLAEAAPAVTIRSTLIRTAPNIYPVHAWTVAQAVHPQLLLLDVEAPIPERAQPWVGFGKRAELTPTVELLAGGKGLAWDFPRGAEGVKIGTLGEWIAAVYEDVVFVQRVELEAGGAYPDGSNVQSHANAQYVELELLSPMRQLQAGERLVNEVRWELMPRRGRTAAELAEVIEDGLLTTETRRRQEE